MELNNRHQYSSYLISKKINSSLSDCSLNKVVPALTKKEFAHEQF